MIPAHSYPHTKEYRRANFNSIQLLRAVAALSVLLFHLQGFLHYAGHPDRSYFTGAAGVDVFFAISGFIIYYTAWDRFQKPNASVEFFTRRLIRVVPTYWFFTAIMLSILMLAPQRAVNHPLEAFDIPNSFFFLFSKSPLLNTGWTLSFEMYFYALLALLLFFPRRHALTLLSLLFGTAVICWYIFEITASSAQIFTAPILLEFLVGCFAAQFVRTKGKLPLPFAVALFVAAIISFAVAAWLNIAADMFGFLRLLIWGMPAAALVIGAVGLEQHGHLPRIAILSVIGDASYSIYLVQPIILPIYAKLWNFFAPQMSPSIEAPFFFFCGFMIAIIGGQMAYVTFEKPITRWLNQKERLIFSPSPTN